jgi:hypothetical protein
MPEGFVTATRARFLILGLLTTAGLALGFNRGQLPRRDARAIENAGCIGATNSTSSAEATAPDLQLYREIVAEVRNGRNYYDAAHEKIPQFGFPISSPLNWRLPTYAWLFSLLPNKCWIQAMLLLLAISGLLLAYAAKQRQSGVGYAAVTTFLLFGVVRWTFDGEAYLAQEVWAAVLVMISLAAHARGRGAQRGREGKGEKGRQAWRWLAVSAGVGALFFRELALPFCGVACLVAAANRSIVEAAAWAVGILAFLAFFAWHVGQVRSQLAGTDVAEAGGLSQWLRLGGLDYVLLTTRMNSLLFHAPAWLLWLYLLASLAGLSRQRDESSVLACLAALAYLVAFAFLGRPENFYWGLLPAPLLAWGTASGAQAVRELLTATPSVSEGPPAISGPCTTSH